MVINHDWKEYHTPNKLFPQKNSLSANQNVFRKDGEMGFTSSLVVCQLLTDHLQNILHWAVRLKYAPERCNQKQTNFSSGSMEREKWVWQPLFWSVSRWLTIFKSKQSWQAPKFCLQWRLICLNGLNQKIIRPLRCFGWMAFDFLHGRNASKPANQA